MVAAAVAWMRAARPELTPFQAGQAVRLGARDVGAPGLRERDRLRRAAASRRARRSPPPADDPLEPNDDIRYVNGRAFRDAAPPLLQRPAGQASSATADFAEDPVDVYRVKVRAGQASAHHAQPERRRPRPVRVRPEDAQRPRQARRRPRRRSGSGPTGSRSATAARKTHDVLRRRRLQRAQATSSCSTRATCCAPAEPAAPGGRGARRRLVVDPLLLGEVAGALERRGRRHERVVAQVPLGVERA